MKHPHSQAPTETAVHSFGFAGPLFWQERLGLRLLAVTLLSR